MLRVIGCTAFAILALWLAACAGVSAPKAEKREQLSRVEFEAQVTGKTRAELLDTVGRPDSTTDLTDVECWVYWRRTTNPVTLKADSYASVRIDRKTGRVVEVRY